MSPVVCPVLLDQAQKPMEGQDPPLNAGMDTKSGKRTSKFVYDEHFRVKILGCFGVDWSLAALKGVRQVQGGVFAGTELKFDASWQRGHELPPFVVDKQLAVDFLQAVLDSPVGTCIQPTVTVSEAVVVQVHRLMTAQQQDNEQASVRIRRPAVYIARASLYYSQRVPQLSLQTLKRLAVALTRKGKVGRMDGGGKRVKGLIENLRLYLNQRRFDLELISLSTAGAD
eukprot:5529038-Pleurochrysis_carterae.AAC.1